MARRRSREAESQSVNRRMLLDFLIGPDQVEELAIRKRHQWPGSTDGDILAPGAVGERHLEREVRDQLGNSTVEHVTLTAEASQDIASGGATVQWADEEGAPTEREGFETLNTELGDGSVGDIPIDVTGHVLILPSLRFTDPTSGDEKAVDMTFAASQIHAGVVADYDEIVDPAASGIDGPVYGWIEKGDGIRLTLDPDETVEVSGTVQISILVTGDTVASSGSPFAWGDPTVTANIPSDTRAGDLLIAHVWSTEPANTTPDGWTRIVDEAEGDSSLLVDYRIAQPGDAGAEVSWTASGGVSRSELVVGIQRVSGVDTDDPFSGTVQSDSTLGSSVGLSTTTDGETRLIMLGSVMTGSEGTGTDELVMPASMSAIYAQAFESAEFRIAASSETVGSGGTGTKTVSIADTEAQILSCALIPVRLA